MTGLLVTVDGPVTTLTIDRADRANALTPAVVDEMRAALAGVQANDTARVVVLRGSGSRVFCGGFDLADVSRDTGDRVLRGLMDDLTECPVPVVAVLDGHAIGAGLELACRADLRFAVHGVRVGLPAVALGVAYRAAGLAAILAASPTLAHSLVTGEQLQVDTVPGLAHAVVDRDEIETVVARAVDGIVASAPAAVEYTMAVLRAWRSGSTAEDLDRRFGDWRTRVMASGDVDEAVAARREGRPPRFGPRCATP